MYLYNLIFNRKIVIIEDSIKDILLSQINNDEYSSVFFCSPVIYRNVSGSYLQFQKGPGKYV